MIGLICLAVALAILNYLLGLFLQEPWKRIVLVLSLIIFVVAALQVLLGISVIGSLRGVLH